MLSLVKPFRLVNDRLLECFPSDLCTIIHQYFEYPYTFDPEVVQNTKNLTSTSPCSDEKDEHMLFEMVFKEGESRRCRIFCNTLLSWAGQSRSLLPSNLARCLTLHCSHAIQS
jgi:hypothetical protein